MTTKKSRLSADTNIWSQGRIKDEQRFKQWEQIRMQYNPDMVNLCNRKDASSMLPKHDYNYKITKGQSHFEELTNLFPLKSPCKDPKEQQAPTGNLKERPNSQVK